MKRLKDRSRKLKLRLNDRGRRRLLSNKDLKLRG
jgi:hypothetical protein